jgi:hypothetical protein
LFASPRAKYRIEGMAAQGNATRLNAERSTTSSGIKAIF